MHHTVATPLDVVDRMLDLSSVTSRDVLHDLRCGDGRIIIAVAQQFGARGVGVNIDPALIAKARRNATRAQVDHLVTFKLQDEINNEVSKAMVVTLYLLSAQNVALRPMLTRQLGPGARIVSHNYYDRRLGSGRRRYVPKRGRTVVDAVFAESSLGGMTWTTPTGGIQVVPVTAGRSPA